ncbi:hypothetical protein GE118_03585 [Mycoplasma sp. NEAQ87857]|uniref:hypothetical protein n=1 Tax=Mycoplasma sp. NEAQ87857 TaxID=2683967 RepID=UPI0013168635|nr:hypothetical protein [Mycoplasma sp. NEAQ87857]QGZ97243.1 hypothetical protein GE118_00295 [Mycoplasma sp. NEAQ87857]QGZ97864.1 hypothetical protein GE118_03585 [Mycoplasma sp. NEAQ87857]
MITSLTNQFADGNAGNISGQLGDTLTNAAKSIVSSIVSPISTIGLILLSLALVFLIGKIVVLWTKRKDGNAEEIKKSLKWNLVGILVCIVLITTFALIVSTVLKF